MAKTAFAGKALEQDAPEGHPGSVSSSNHPCLIAQTLAILGDRWTLLILRDLMSGLHRYTDILDNCSGMSPNVLASRLKRLEAEGLVERKYFRELPPRVEYTLTEKGWAVRPILLSLVGWGRKFFEPFPIESVGVTIPTDFAVRTAPAFLFDPRRAVGVEARMVVELSDCPDCNTWSFEIREGRIYPRRRELDAPDLRLVATTPGFFQFLRGEAAPEACGTLTGSPEMAAAVQACFIPA